MRGGGPHFTLRLASSRDRHILFRCAAPGHKHIKCVCRLLRANARILVVNKGVGVIGRWPLWPQRWAHPRTALQHLRFIFHGRHCAPRALSCVLSAVCLLCGGVGGFYCPAAGVSWRLYGKISLGIVVDVVDVDVGSLWPWSGTRILGFVCWITRARLSIYDVYV